MAKRIGAAILAATLTFGGSVAGNAASAVPSQAVMQKPQTGGPTDFSARLRTQHQHRAIHRQTYRPYYYDRPVYYAPAPFFPFLGLGYGPWW
jgi:hypothetical protein